MEKNLLFIGIFSMISRNFFYDKQSTLVAIWTLIIFNNSKVSNSIVDTFDSLNQEDNTDFNYDKFKAQLILNLAIKGFKLVSIKPENYIGKIIEDSGTVEDITEYIIKA